ncbi:MAG: tetratricopeptide repeat protein, partial [Actinomycetota bacterium]|nr:tetratricopeptide repeat protein [Actinomycetota bacterium]
MASEAVIRELTAAVERSPDAMELRLHLADLLIQTGSYTEALTHCSTALAQDSGNSAALSLLQRCTAALATGVSDELPAAESKPEFNWSAAEEEVSDIIGPAFVQGDGDGSDCVGAT